MNNSIEIKETKRANKKKHFTITAAAFVASIALIAAAAVLISFFLPKVPGMENCGITVARAIKLEMYDNMPQAAIDGLKNGDISATADYAMSVADAMLSGKNISEADRENIKDALMEKLQELLNSNVLEFDAEGNIANLSKAYIANAVLNAFTEAYPDIEKEMLENAENYKRITDLSDYLDKIDKTNKAISDYAGNVDSLKGMISGEHGDMTPAELQAMLEAMRTSVEVNGYCNDTASDDEYRAKVAGLQNAMGKLDETQLMYVKQLNIDTDSLQAAISNTSGNTNGGNNGGNNSISDNQGNSNQGNSNQGNSGNSNSNKTSQKEIDEIKKALNGVNENLAATQGDREELEKRLTALINAGQSSGGKDLGNAKEEIAENIGNTRREINDALDEASTLNDSERGKIKQALEDYEAANNAALEATNQTVDQNRQEAEENLEDAKQELSDALDDAASLSQSERDRIEQALEDYKIANNDALKTTNDTVESNRVEANSSLIRTKNKLTNAMNESNSLSQSERDRIEKALKDYEAANNAALATTNDTAAENKRIAEENLANAKAELTNSLNESNSMSQSERDRIEQALDDYRYANDAALDLTNRTTAENLANAKTELANALNESNNLSQSERDRIEKALKDYETANNAALDTTNNTAAENKRIAEENLQQAKTYLTNTLNESNSMSQSERNRIEKALDDYKDANDAALDLTNRTTAENLATAKTELNNTISTEKNASQAERDRIETALNDYIAAATAEHANINTSIGNVNKRLDECVAAINGVLSEHRQLIQDNADAIVALGNTLRSEMNEMGSALSAEINDLRTQIRDYMLSVDSHSKIDVINDITISSWTNVGNGRYTAAITNNYFKGCTSAQVNYAQQYNIYPTYEVNGANGTLKIILNSNPGAIKISSIVVYHTSNEATISEADLASMMMLAMELQETGYDDLSVDQILKVMEVSEEIKSNPDRYSIQGLRDVSDGEEINVQKDETATGSEIIEDAVGNISWNADGNTVTIENTNNIKKQATETPTEAPADITSKETSGGTTVITEITDNVDAAEKPEATETIGKQATEGIEITDEEIQYEAEDDSEPQETTENIETIEDIESKDAEGSSASASITLE